MIEFFIFIFIVYGISNAVVFASGPFRIFEHYRSFMKKMPSNLGEGVDCMICTPFQVGIILSLINMFIIKIPFTPLTYLTKEYYDWLFGAFLTDNWYIKMILDGAVASGSCWFIHTLQEYFENNTLNNRENE